MEGNMHNKLLHHLGRRDFIKYSLLTAGALSMPAIQGCAISRKNVPSLNYKTSILIKNARLVDVISGQIIENAWLLVNKGIITAQGTGEAQKNSQSIVFDMKGKYLIPGLIDAHCHSTATSVFSMRMIDLHNHSRQQKQNYASLIESGVTTIRDMGAFPLLLHLFMKDIEYGYVPGPRVLYCNSMLNLRGSHPEIPPSDVNIFARPASLFVGMIMNNFKDTKEMEECLVENSRGASFIKLTLDDKTLFCKKNKEIPVYTKEQLDLIFRFAEKAFLPVVGHHQFKFGFDRAMEYPFHSLEHIVTDTVLSDDDVMKMAKRNVAIVPTMAIAQSFIAEEAYDKIPEKHLSPEVTKELQVRKEHFEKEAVNHVDPLFHRQNIDALKFYKTIGKDKLWAKKKFLVDPDIYFNMINNGYASLKKMNQAGVLIGCGIDAGMPFSYFGANYREYELLQRVGFSNIEILRCATINNAKILLIGDQTGSLETGKYADMVALDKNPLEDIRALRKPQMVFKQGDLMFSASNLHRDGIIAAIPATA
jgi:imidazolonepropionase-like amidohydrolase